MSRGNTGAGSIVGASMLARTSVLVLFLASALAVPGAAHANCTPGALDLWQGWPANGATGVPTNAHVLVQVFGTAGYVSRPPTFVLRAASGEVVALTAVVDLASGTSEMQQRSLVLRPVHALTASTTYSLEVLGAASPSSSPHAFTTGTVADVLAPSAASVTAGPLSRFESGCGPSEDIPLEVRATDDGPALWLRVAVASDEAALAAGRIEGELIVPVATGYTLFGHGMCIGNWPLEPGDRLVGRMTVLDLALNETPAGDVVLDAR